MKKEYINPETTVIELQSESMMLSASTNNTLGGTLFGGYGTGLDADALNRRDGLDDLWN